MLTENRAKDICKAYYNTKSMESVAVDDKGNVIAIILDYDSFGNKYALSAVLYIGWAQLFVESVFDEIMEDFEAIGYEAVEEYLGEDNYDWFVSEYAGYLKVQVA